MTTEAALTKLSYLLDRFSKQEDVEHYMLSNMRGEVTPEEKAHFSLMDNEFLRSIAEAMAKEGSQSVDAVTQQIVKVDYMVIRSRFVLRVQAIGLGTCPTL